MYSEKWLFYKAVALFCVIQKLRSENIYQFELVIKSNSTPEVDFKFNVKSDKIEGNDPPKVSDNSKLPAISNARPDEIKKPDANADLNKKNTPVMVNGRPVAAEKPNLSEDRPMSDIIFRGTCELPTYLPNANISLASNSDSNGITLTYFTSGRQETQDFVCEISQWIPVVEKGMPTCPSLLWQITFDPTCYFKGLNVSCESVVKGTLARLECAKGFDARDNTNITCSEDGSWNPKPVSCREEADCGRGTPHITIEGGQPTLVDEFPWIVGIYRNLTDEQPTLICGGTLISKSYFLSAAHCFTDAMGSLQPKETYFIGAGKSYRDLKIAENTSQFREVKRLIVHEDFRGNIYKYRDDIALVEVEEPFDIGAKVNLICVDWENESEDQDFVENRSAVVAGWGFTKMASNPADVLQKLVVPYRTNEDCRENMDPEFYRLHFTSDKICAGFKDEAKGICNGDSGSGLYFASESGQNYIRGITSLTRRSEDTGACDTNHYALYTKVSKYLSWIRGFTGGID